MKEIKKFELATLRHHPSQPPTRTQDTTGLQASMKKTGQLVPIVVANDNRTVISGWRRCTAAKALGWKVIAGYSEQIDPADPGALDFVIAANEQEAMTALQLIAVLRSYEEHGINFREACRRSGIKSWKARTLARLSGAPQEVQEAVDLYERKGKGEGISLTAFYQMQDLSSEEQLAILRAGKKTTVEVRTERKKLRAETATALVEDPTSVQAMITAAHELAIKAIAIADWLQTANPRYTGDVKIAYSAALPALHQLIETEKDAT